MVNWHHQAKTNPGTIVGESTKAEIRKDGLYIETLQGHFNLIQDGIFGVLTEEAVKAFQIKNNSSCYYKRRLDYCRTAYKLGKFIIKL